MKLQTGKTLTYEEIGQKLSISPQQVHKIERDAFNKIIKRYMVASNKDIFNTILDVSVYLGIDPSQSLKKLDTNNYQKMAEYIKENYDTEIEGYIKDESNSFLSLFK